MDSIQSHYLGSGISLSLSQIQSQTANVIESHIWKVSTHVSFSYAISILKNIGLTNYCYWQIDWISL